jgi:hypothetical protein
VVSRTWRQLKGDWETWCRRDLAGEDVVRLILDGTVVRVRLDRKATSISLLVVLGVRRDGQKVLLAAKNMGGESEAAWRAVLDDLIARGLRTPDFLIVDGAAGLERALAALWPDVPAQRCGIPSGKPLGMGCMVQKYRNLLAHAPDALHEEIPADYTAMIHTARGQGDRAAPAGLPAQVAAEVPDRAALGRDGSDAVLGAARLGPDHHVQGRRLAHPRSGARRQHA